MNLIYSISSNHFDTIFDISIFVGAGQAGAAAGCPSNIGLAFFEVQKWKCLSHQFNDFNP